MPNKLQNKCANPLVTVFASMIFIYKPVTKL